VTLPMFWPAPAEPFGPSRDSHDWMRKSACSRREVDPDWFTSDEEDFGAIERAREVCAGCPVQLLCRLHAEQHEPFGVYAGETAGERTQRLRVRARRLKEVG
jgi:hypothetical protein